MSKHDSSAARILLPHLFGHATVLALLVLLSIAGDAWGYFVLYAGVTAALGVVIGVTWGGHRILRRDQGAPARRRDIALRILHSFWQAEVTLGLAILAVAVLARLGSGPIGPFAGGAFQESTTRMLPSDLPPSDVKEIQIQIPSDPPYSITTHAFAIDGDLYVGADFVFPFKRWIHTVQTDPRVLVRLDGQLFRCRAVRVQDPAQSRHLLEEVSRQRGVHPDDWLTDVWFFRMEPAS